MAIDILQYSNLESFKKLGFLVGLLQLQPSEISKFLELDEQNVNDTLVTGKASSKTRSVRERRKVEERLYNFFILLNYLLKISKYDDRDFRSMWIQSDNTYDDAYEKPPWVKDGLNYYLQSNKYSGLESCLEWIGYY